MVVRLAASTAAFVAIASGASARISFAVGISLAVLVAAALVDVHERRLPNTIIGSALIVTVSAGFLGSLGASVFVPAGAMKGAAVCVLPVLALHLASPHSMGFGDVKLSFVLGSALGAVDWRLALWALIIGSAASAAFALAHRRPNVAFGPGLVGAGIALMAFIAVSHAFQMTGS